MLPQKLSNAISYFFILFLVRKLVYLWKIKGLKGAILYCFEKSLGFILKNTRRIPFVQLKVNTKLDEVILDLKSKIQQVNLKKLPDKGLTLSELETELLKYSLIQVDHTEGKLSGSVYHDISSTTEDFAVGAARAFCLFAHTNPMHVFEFPGVYQMEKEIVSWTLDMFNGPQGSCGNLTSGGTESIFLACLACRTQCNTNTILALKTAHAAIDKAGHYLKMEVIRVDDEKMFESVINSNTMLYVSAPCFPHGRTDDVEFASNLAIKYNVPLHVDCCLGSFLVPFQNNIVDFRHRGVTSISVDNHKYGYSPKGVSTIMYRTKNLRQGQYFTSTDWPGGIYASPSFAGSRSGALIAATWATMRVLGKQGYQNAAREIQKKTKIIKEGIKELGIELIGDAQFSVVCFKPKSVYSVYDYMHSKGWALNLLQFPESIHIAITMLTKCDVFLQDLKEANQQPDSKSKSAFYGTAAHVPDRSVVHELCIRFLDL